MADVLNIGRSVKNLRTTPKFFPVSAIRMIVSDNKDYESGTDTGYEFEAESPWATQAQANWLLTKMQGLEYVPFEAERGLLRPEAEIGDYVNIRGVFGGLFSEDINFGKGYTATFGAPADNDIDHEYQFETKQDRALRQKMSKKSPTGNTAFGWELDDDHWSVFNEDDNDNKQEIFRVSASGAWLRGSFEIVGGSIELRKSDNTQAFVVDEDGNVTITGSLTLQGTVITASKLREGAVDGYNWQNGSYGGTTKAGYSLTGGGYGYNYNDATATSNPSSFPSYFKADQIRAVSTLIFAGYDCAWQQITINGSTYRVMIASV